MLLRDRAIWLLLAILVLKKLAQMLDTIVRNAVVTILNQLCEEDSHGVSSMDFVLRSQHQTLDALFWALVKKAPGVDSDTQNT